MFIELAFREIGVPGPILRAGSGSEAVSYLMGEDKYADRSQFPFPAFVITDLKMSEGDGFEVLEHLQANPEWAIIPTVVLTASEDPDDICTAYRLGASCYHVKPTGYHELCKLLKAFYDYWMTCRVPEVDVTGKHSPTNSTGKAGARFERAQAKVKPTRRRPDTPIQADDG